ncbi:MAG: two component transcriptional regulator, LuxR family [Pedosphaera sp.]|nr:two component transcriptional regulator, LuxR family [Pedosphaera sp.]
MPAMKLPPEKSKHRVFLVDDHPIMREGFAQLINHEPGLHVCGCAATPPKALDAIESLKPDLAIIDVSLNGMNGIELIKNILSRRPGQLILTLSMHDESVHGERALRAGARGYVMKNEPTEEIMTAIREVLRGEVYLSKRMRSIVVQKFLNGGGGPGRSGVEELSDRELEVFQLIGGGHKTRQIADQLHLSVKTVETYRAHIKEKLQLKDGMELVRHAVRWTSDQH